MIRVTAIALLLVVSSPSLLACIFDDNESALPPCCRRDGKHHCAMMAKMVAQQVGGVPSMRAGGERCPYRNAVFVRTTRHSAAMPLSLAFYARAISHPATVVQVAAIARISDLRSDSKRGPPSSRS